MGAFGSGLVFDSTGYVVTINHVIDGASEVKVRFATKVSFGSNRHIRRT